MSDGTGSQRVRMKPMTGRGFRLWCAASLVFALSSTPLAQDWPHRGGNPGEQRFSPLTQITPDNVASLTTAWTFDVGASNLQVTPIVVNGVMYLSGGSNVFALEPETGKVIWQ